MIVGYVDHIVDRAATLIGSSGRIAEAARRRRVEASPEDVFVERLFGLTLTRSQVERGRNFVHGVLERAGDEGLQQLFHAPPNSDAAEVDAPGLWLARSSSPPPTTDPNRPVQDHRRVSVSSTAVVEASR